MDIALIFNFLLFGNVSWTTNMRPYGHWKLYVIYCVYIGFIQSSSSNHWIKISFDSKWIWSLKMLLCKFQSFLLVFKLAKWCHQYLLYITFFEQKWLTLGVSPWNNNLLFKTKPLMFVWNQTMLCYVRTCVFFVFEKKT